MPKILYDLLERYHAANQLWSMLRERKAALKSQVFPTAFLGSWGGLQLLSGSESHQGTPQPSPTHGWESLGSSPPRRSWWKKSCPTCSPAFSPLPWQPSPATVDNQHGFGFVNIFEMFQGFSLFPWVSLFPARLPWGLCLLSGGYWFPLRASIELARKSSDRCLETLSFPSPFVHVFPYFPLNDK